MDGLYLKGMLLVTILDLPYRNRAHRDSVISPVSELA